MGKDLDREKRVLRLLCAGTSEGAVREVLVPLLDRYAWRSTLHQAIFDAIRAAPSIDSELLRRFLPAKLTRMGFPDIEWDEIFSPTSLSREDAIALVRQMLAAA